MNKGIELYFKTEGDAYTKIEEWSREGKFKNPMDKSRCKKIITGAFKNPKNTESKFISAFNFEEKINSIITKNILINISFLVIYSLSLLKNLKKIKY